MKLRLTFNFTENELKILAAHYGQRKITREIVRLWVEGTVDSTFQIMVSDYEREEKWVRG